LLQLDSRNSGHETGTIEMKFVVYFASLSASGTYLHLFYSVQFPDPLRQHAQLPHVNLHAVQYTSYDIPSFIFIIFIIIIIIIIIIILLTAIHNHTQQYIAQHK
jgi:hypothetical protein